MNQNLLKTVAIFCLLKILKISNINKSNLKAIYAENNQIAFCVVQVC